MDSNRLQQIEELYHAARECAPAVRTALLEQSDPEIRHEVESLLALDAGEGPFDRPAVPWMKGHDKPGVATGTHFGPYQILEPIGAGGMGEVYRAEDTRLRRAVAIKILRDNKLASDEARLRFLHEARAASALNHQNIVQIHELGSRDDGDYIVMEFVSGQTLAQLLAARRLSVEEALNYAEQIASALAAAHSAGVVHRDLKPGNIIVTKAGVVKVIDFGLAKLDPDHRDEEGGQTAGPKTAAGAVMGTALYMSPEQAQGKPVDARSDIFSTGAVLYEMFTGTRAFASDSTLAVMNRVLADDPPDIRKLRGEVPVAVERIVRRCLQKDRALRHSSGQELLAEWMRAVRAGREVASRARSRIFIAAAVIAGIVSSGWFYFRYERARWARNEALPKIEALVAQADSLGAFELTRAALGYAPDDPQLKQHWANVSSPIAMTTTPPGATLSYRSFGDGSAPWHIGGRTPLANVRMPNGLIRVRLEKEGAETLEIGTMSGFLMGQNIPLPPTGQIPQGMVLLPENAPWAGQRRTMVLPDYFLDKFEVTNRQFRQFMKAGGYRDLKYWRYPFRKDGRDMPAETVLASFTDTTGRPGPSGWELGEFPKDQEDFPVSGISWFEAAAYCESQGKALPTVHHWRRAAAFNLFSDIILFSNYSKAGPARVGSNTGITPFGVYDMAGNVREWCQNDRGGRRAILGGGWDEANYRFLDGAAEDPFKRTPTNGVRCALYKGEVPAEALAPMGPPARDYTKEKPVVDSTFEVFRTIYAYDRPPLDAKTESIDESNASWRKEKVSYTAAYGGERIPAYLFLPKNVDPPYQTLLYFPGGDAFALPNSTIGARTDDFDFLVRTGRAVLYPVYHGTFERHGDSGATGPNAQRDWTVMFTKDVSRSVDFLSSRPEIQPGRIGYYGLSMGGTFGTIFLAVEPRFKTGILVAGALFAGKGPPEADPLNFAPRVRLPVLMLNGRVDFELPYETLQKPLFRLLGTPEPAKRHVLFETGHVPAVRDLRREVLKWLDNYMGPVEAKR